MPVLLALLHLVLFCFLVALLVRLVFSWVQGYAPRWRPSGAALVLAEGAYTVTDPPLSALRRVLPPLNLGAVSLDLGFLVLALGTSLLLGVVQSAIF
ncbi:YggT family protein [Kytococcus aerolatus]|uniref:YggT family protein n=1 Tax=Kytococcus aerolatus TaxID=592308 RepID=A0A212T555_9MICO|nr:YggT family protein [Kytococcus aerolatus]SNC60894.1 YggT family protein [Kytococcus aerolatus]